MAFPVIANLRRVLAKPTTAADVSGALYRIAVRSMATKPNKKSKGKKENKDCVQPGMTCCKRGLKGCEAPKEERKPSKDEKKIPPECIENPCCPDPPIKYDEEYADQLKHKPRTEFTKTWKECPPRRTIQKVICAGGIIEEPKKCEEKKPIEKPEACPPQGGKCPKITMPGCKAAMVHKKCKNWPVPSDCKKVKAPYPSFSECARPKPKPLHPTECGCLALRSMCEVYTMMRKKGKKIKVKQRQ